MTIGSSTSSSLIVAMVILAVLIPVAFAVGMLTTWLFMRRRRDLEKDQNATSRSQELRHDDIPMETNECYEQMKEANRHVESTDLNTSSTYEIIQN